MRRGGAVSRALVVELCTHLQAPSSMGSLGTDCNGPVSLAANVLSQKKTILLYCATALHCSKNKSVASNRCTLCCSASIHFPAGPLEAGVTTSSSFHSCKAAIPGPGRQDLAADF